MSLRRAQYLSTFVKSRSVAESNASLLEAFSQIIQNPRSGGVSARPSNRMIIRSANALVPAPEFNAEHQNINREDATFSEFGGVRFKPGDVLEYN